jgi:hypothetical protein
VESVAVVPVDSPSLQYPTSDGSDMIAVGYASLGSVGSADAARAVARIPPSDQGAAPVHRSNTTSSAALGGSRRRAAAVA